MLAAAWDLERHRIPNALILIALLPALAVLVLTGQAAAGAPWPSALLGAALGALLLLPGYALGQLGAGDVKMSATLGLLLGWPPLLLCLLLAALLLGLAAGVLWPYRRSRMLIPVAPCLAGGVLLVLLPGLVP